MSREEFESFLTDEGRRKVEAFFAEVDQEIRDGVLYDGMLNEHPLVTEHLANQAHLAAVLLELDMLGHPAAGLIREIAARAEKAEAEVNRYRSFCGEALCGDIERDRDTLLADNARLRALVADEHSRLLQELENEETPDA